MTTREIVVFVKQFPGEEIGAEKIAKATAVSFGNGLYQVRVEPMYRYPDYILQVFGAEEAERARGTRS